VVPMDVAATFIPRKWVFSKVYLIEPNVATLAKCCRSTSQGDFLGCLEAQIACTEWKNFPFDLDG
jgi:hypothetical protein